MITPAVQESLLVQTELDLTIKVFEWEMQGHFEKEKEIVYVEVKPAKIDHKSISVQVEPYIMTYDVTCQTPTKK